jgi:uncharacterized protein YkwD
MARRTTRRTFRLECLEKREVLSAPTPDQQYTLWLLNQARQDPAEAANLVTQNIDPATQDTIAHFNQTMGTDTAAQAVARVSSATPTQPLAWNDTLASAATFQSQDQINSGVESHNSSIGNLSSRLSPTHFNYANSVNIAEDAYAYADSPMNAMQAFLIDWGVQDRGHSRNILQPNTASNMQFSDVGVGIVSSNQNGMGPEVITVDFGRQSSSQPQVLGVVYNDPTNSHVFTPGSGVGGVTINATNVATGQTSSTQTWAAGGYQMVLAAGTYQIQAIQNGQTIGSQQVTISNQNVETDFTINGAPTPAVFSPSLATPTNAATNVTPALPINPLNPALPVSASLLAATTPTPSPAAQVAMSVSAPVTPQAPPVVTPPAPTTPPPAPVTPPPASVAPSQAPAAAAVTISIPIAPTVSVPVTTTPAIAGKSSTPLFSSSLFSSWQSWSNSSTN